MLKKNKGEKLLKKFSITEKFKNILHELEAIG